MAIFTGKLETRGWFKLAAVQPFIIANATNTLVFTQSATYTLSLPTFASNILTFTQSAINQHIIIRFIQRIWFTIKRFKIYSYILIQINCLKYNISIDIRILEKCTHKCLNIASIKSNKILFHRDKYIKFCYYTW